MDIIRQLGRHTAVRYVLVGGTSFAIELSCLLAMYYVLHFSLAVATSIAYALGLVIAFGLQKIVAFRDKRRQLHILAWQAVLFGVITVFNWLFTVEFVGLFPASYLLISRPLAQIIFASWNYFLYKNIIFTEADRVKQLWQRLNGDNFVWWSVGLVASWRLLLEVVNQISQYIFHNHLPSFANVLRWANWDGGWYFNVNNVGYTRVPNELGQENVAFFPGFPETVGVLARIFHLDFMTTGLILNFLLTIALTYLVMKLSTLLAQRFGLQKERRTIALLSAIALLLLPSSFFLVAYYAEAMLALGVVGAAYFTLRRRLWLAVPFMIMATASKVIGIVAVFTVMAIVLEQWWQDRGTMTALVKQWAISLIGFSGLLAYVIYLWVRFKDPLLFYHVQHEWGRNGHGFFLSRLLKDYYFHIFDPSHFGGVYGYSINLCWMLTPIVVLTIAVIAWRRYKMYWPMVLAGLTMALPLSTGIPDSLYRYALAAIPLLPIAVIWLRTYKTSVFYSLLGVSGFAMLCFAAGFLSGKYFSG